MYMTPHNTHSLSSTHQLTASTAQLRVPDLMVVLSLATPGPGVLPFSRGGHGGGLLAYYSSKVGRRDPRVVPPGDREQRPFRVRLAEYPPDDPEPAARALGEACCSGGSPQGSERLGAAQRGRVKQPTAARRRAEKGPRVARQRMRPTPEGLVAICAIRAGSSLEPKSCGRFFWAFE